MGIERAEGVAVCGGSSAIDMIPRLLRADEHGICAPEMALEEVAVPGYCRHCTRSRASDASDEILRMLDIAALRGYTFVSSS
jgi:hypothetical protein